MAELPAHGESWQPLARPCSCSWGGGSPAALVRAHYEELDAAALDGEIDVGLLLGGGGAVNIGRMGALALEVRYNLGLRNLNTSDVVPDAFHRAIYFTVGYRADLATPGRLFGGASR